MLCGILCGKWSAIGNFTPARAGNAHTQHTVDIAFGTLIFITWVVTGTDARLVL